MPTMGVLAIQGGFQKHLEAYERLGCQTWAVRKPEELAFCDSLTIPGGESTTLLKAFQHFRYREAISEFAQTRPVFGTCAGMILMSRSVEGEVMFPLGLMEVTLARNAYGRQRESFLSSVTLRERNFPALFIRAPRIVSMGQDVEVLASHKDSPVLVKQGRHLAASFHPELTGDLTVHELFIEMVGCAVHQVSY